MSRFNRRSNKPEHRVVLIDNGSKTPYPESDAYDLVRLPENLFIPADQCGIRYAQRQYPDAPGLVCLTTTLKFVLVLFANLTSDLETNVGLVGNKHLRMDDPTLVVHGGTADLLTGMHKAGPDDPHFDRRSRDVWVTFCMSILLSPASTRSGS